MLVALALVAGLVAGRSGPDLGEVDGPPLPAGTGQVRVQRVVDGDTVQLAGRGKARLIGVDTPEVHGGRECFGSEASEFTTSEVQGSRVSYAVGREQRDRYGRLLVYLWKADGQSVNARLVAGGYARPLTIRPNDRYAPLLNRLARDARGRGDGLWGAC